MGKLIFKMLLIVGIMVGISNYMLYIMTGKSPFADFKLPSFSSFKFKAPKIGIDNPLNESLSSGANQAYKWTDENGTVHYSSEPPPGIDSKEKLAEATARNTLQKINVDPNINLIQGEKIVEEKEPETKPDTEPMTKNVYSPGGAKKLMEDAKNVEKLLNDRHLKQQEMLEGI